MFIAIVVPNGVVCKYEKWAKRYMWKCFGKHCPIYKKVSDSNRFTYFEYADLCDHLLILFTIRIAIGAEE